MRFWQAAVTAQMASGSVWADRFTGMTHTLAEVSAVAVGVLMWLILDRLCGSAGK